MAAGAAALRREKTSPTTFSATSVHCRLIP
jgi:hypothetical protein